MAQLKNVADIRPYLEKQAAVKLIHAFLGSRLDYCNSLLVGIPETFAAGLSTSKIITVIRGPKTCGASYPSQILWWQSIFCKDSKFMEFTPPAYENNVIDVHI